MISNTELQKRLPELSPGQIERITELVFLPESRPEKCDLIFIFGGSRAGLWEKAHEAFTAGLGNFILAAGGYRPNAKIRTAEWEQKYGKIAEAEILKHHLIELGVPSEKILIEDKSTNSLENVLFAREVFNFKSIKSVLIVCKNFMLGRQSRTIKHNLPPHLVYSYSVFDVEIDGVPIDRKNWADTKLGRAVVFGEYLRLVLYGRKGDIEGVDEIEGLIEEVERLLDV